MDRQTTDGHDVAKAHFCKPNQSGNKGLYLVINLCGPVVEKWKAYFAYLLFLGNLQHGLVK